ncbi:MAG: hypothetical protein IT449_02270 [Phycisphaerales bacterium]|nr:hypothetical protein [Phycisphaerales bacterium]
MVMAAFERLIGVLAMNTRAAVIAISAAMVCTSALGAEVLHDNLCITEQGLYDRYPFNICGGDAYFGHPENWQLADRFEIDESYWITTATVDYITVFGVAPESVCARFFEGRPPEYCTQPYARAHCGETMLAGSFDWDPIEGDFGEFEGRRATVRFREMCRLTEGKWYLSMQPVTGQDVAATLAADFDDDHPCLHQGCMVWRWGVVEGSCCMDDSDPEWDATDPEPDTLSMRIEGIPAGDCVDGEIVTARCRPGDNERPGKIIVKVRDGQPNGTVTALLDPPDPKSMSIPLDDRGHGKEKFKDVPLGEHRVFVCDAIVDVTCAP